MKVRGARAARVILRIRPAAGAGAARFPAGRFGLFLVSSIH
jgi:hypothetical protein